MPRYGERRVLPDGTVMFIYYSGPRMKPQKCYYCSRPHEFLCDWLLVTDKKTCDRPLCKVHAMKPIATFGKPETADIDYCPEHYQLYKKDMMEIKNAV
jgi:hypothetical protein